MTNEELEQQKQKQQKENEEYLQKILPEVKKEFDEVCKKHGVMLGARIELLNDGLRAIPAIRVAEPTNPYKQS